MTNNNHPAMKTVVETFVIEETAELIYNDEKLTHWNDLVKELGLEGQNKIVKPEKSPIPFLHLKQGLYNILQQLCPVKVDVFEYDKSPIPVEILDLIALSKREKYFNQIQIWYDDKSPDPVCVGSVTKYGKWGKYKWDTVEEATMALGEEVSRWSKEETHYLIGKWGDVKQSFEELREKAMKRFFETKGAELRKQIKDAQRGLDDLESDAINAFTI